MCLTAKPMLECTGSDVQVVPAGMGLAGAMAGMFLLLIRTVVRLTASTVAREPDHGPVRLSCVLMPPPLPVSGAERPERADAASNRRKVLAAAEALFARCDPATVSMDQVAAEAGVGKGTLFRRFGDRASLARAIVSEHESRLQEEIIRGEPPLGP